MDYSLRRPLACLSPLQRLLWPLIFVQLVALRLWVRRHYGRGVPYRLRISPLGRVWLVWIPADLTWSNAAPAALLPPAFAFTTGAARPARAGALVPEATPRAPAPMRRTQTIIPPAGLRPVQDQRLDSS